MMLMTEEDTIEVNPSHLSDEVLEGLVEEADIDRDEAMEMAEDVHFQEMDVRDPVSKNVLESGVIKSRRMWDKLEVLYGKISSKTAKPVIENVTPNNTGVDIEINHPKLNPRVLSLSSDSVKLANLMSYHEVNDPSELEGKKLVLSKISDLNKDKSIRRSSYKSVDILFPNNVSVLGKLRYKLFSALQDARSKTKYWINGDPFEAVAFLMIGYTISFILTLFIGAGGADLAQLNGGILVGIVSTILMLPFFAVLLAGVGIVTWVVMRIVMMGLYVALKGNFEETEL